MENNTITQITHDTHGSAANYGDYADAVLNAINSAARYEWVGSIVVPCTPPAPWLPTLADLVKLYAAGTPSTASDYTGDAAAERLATTHERVLEIRYFGDRAAMDADLMAAELDYVDDNFGELP